MGPLKNLAIEAKKPLRLTVLTLDVSDPALRGEFLSSETVRRSEFRGGGAYAEGAPISLFAFRPAGPRPVSGKLDRCGL